TRWNHEVPKFKAFVAAANKAQKGRLTLTAGTPTTITATTVTPSTSIGTSKGQLLRTLSSNTDKLNWASTDLGDIRNAYAAAIGQAQQYIYIENQYLRDFRLATWITAQWESIPDLQVIIVLPLAPEELFRGNVDDITKNGMALQYNVLQTLDQAA